MPLHEGAWIWIGYVRVTFNITFNRDIFAATRKCASAKIRIKTSGSLSNADKLHTSTNLPVLSGTRMRESSPASLPQKVARILDFAYENTIFIYDTQSCR